MYCITYNKSPKLGNIFSRTNEHSKSLRHTFSCDTATPEGSITRFLYTTLDKKPNKQNTKGYLSQGTGIYISLSKSRM